MLIDLPLILITKTGNIFSYKGFFPEVA